MPNSHHDELMFLVSYLLEERNDATRKAELEKMDAAAPIDGKRLWNLFRGLVNTRQPAPASEEFLAAQDALLKSLIAEAGITTLDGTRPTAKDARIRLWHGDITTLATDGIVNAANSQMLGCWVPGHYCIDNAIHTYAGVQLRLACSEIMQAQGHEEPTGTAKVTSAFNLPSKYIVHTVGPIANGRPTPQHEKLLASCYESCLDAAVAHEMRSLAFCCISTGVFGFPQKTAAKIAVNTVQQWLAAHPETNITVVFNTFLEEDERIYKQLLN